MLQEERMKLFEKGREYVNIGITQDGAVKRAIPILKNIP